MEETKTIEISQKLFYLLVALVLLVAIFALGELSYKFKSLPENVAREISVTGEGKAFTKPDIAIINLGVSSQGFKSQDVVNQNNEKMNKVIKSVKDLGIEDKDIRTTIYNLSPLYDYTESGRIFRGYSLEQQIQVKIRNFDKINDVLDRATSSGANTVGGLQFTLEDMEKVKSEARKEAVNQAKNKAKSLFESVGLEMGEIVSINEGYSSIPQPYGLGGSVSFMEKSVSPQIESGQLEVNVTVTLTYRIDD